MFEQRILLLEDDAILRAGLTFDLQEEGYQVVAVKRCKEAVQYGEMDKIDLAILDINLPDGDGREVCKKLKQLQNVPVIFLTAKDLVEDQIIGFEAGADDYVVKPFSNILLRKRIQAILKRNIPNFSENKYNDGYLMVDFQNFIASKNGESLMITPTEYKLLQILIVNVGSVVTRQMLLEKLWDNSGNFVDEHALTVNINRLRNKIEQNGRKYIRTVYGLGYTWEGERIG